MDNDVTYTIAEASEMLGGVSYRTLHYYEQVIGLHINRDANGNRIYSDYDIELFEKIIDLKKKGLTLNGIKALFKEKGLIPENNNDLILVDENALKLKDYIITELRNTISAQIAAQLREELKNTNDMLEKVLSENAALREELQMHLRKSEDHYNRIDQQLSDWRASMSRPWYQKLFGKKEGK